MHVQVALHNAKTEEVRFVRLLITMTTGASRGWELSNNICCVTARTALKNSAVQVGRFQLRLHRDMVVADVLRLLRERAGSAWQGRPLRLLRLQDSQIYKVRAVAGVACEEGDLQGT